jgi:hypothetical protein
MNLDPLSPDSATVVLAGYAIGFANILRAHPLNEYNRHRILAKPLEGTLHS